MASYSRTAFHTLLDGANGTGAGATGNVANPGKQGTLYVHISDTATGQLQGRHTSDDEWVTIEEKSESDVVQVPLPPQIRANVSSHTGGTVTMKVFESDH